MARRTAVPHLEGRHYRRVFRVLELCDGAEDLQDFKVRLTAALAEIYQVRSTTFFTGATTQLACADPAPTITGITRPMLPEYQEHWHRFDVMASTGARKSLQASGVVSLLELPAVGSTVRSYVVDYLQRNKIESASAVELKLNDGQRALVGLFDRSADAVSHADLASLRLLARPLERIALDLAPPASSVDPLAGLSPRQREVAVLVSEGLGNAAIGQLLCLQEDSVKKYVSRILAIAGCKNRTELAIKVREAG